MDADAIVVGAGASGLAAAARLCARGRHATVLEARGRLGGRIHTDRTFAGFPLELGAEFISGRRSRSAQIVEGAGFARVPAMSMWRGRVFDEARVRRLVPWLARYGWGLLGLLRELERPRALDEAVADVLDRRAVSPRLRRFLDALANSGCASAEQLSRREIARWMVENEEAGGEARLPDGYDRVVDHLARGITIVRDAPVREIRWSDSGVTVEADRSYAARAAIVTVPLGVLKSGAPRFSPPLPAATSDAIERLAMHGGMKVVLRFSTIFWPRDLSFLLLDPAVPVLWPPRPDAAVLTAFVMGARADALRTTPGPVERVLACLERAFGAEARRAFVDALAFDWGAESWTRGGYSSVPPGASGLRQVLAEPCGSLILAGEAADSLAPGTVGGAIRAGERAADAALARLG